MAFDVIVKIGSQDAQSCWGHTEFGRFIHTEHNHKVLMSPCYVRIVWKFTSIEWIICTHGEDVGRQSVFVHYMNI